MTRDRPPVLISRPLINSISFHRLRFTNFASSPKGRCFTSSWSIDEKDELDGFHLSRDDSFERIPFDFSLVTHNPSIVFRHLLSSSSSSFSSWRVARRGVKGLRLVFGLLDRSNVRFRNVGRVTGRGPRSIKSRLMASPGFSNTWKGRKKKFGYSFRIVLLASNATSNIFRKIWRRSSFSKESILSKLHSAKKTRVDVSIHLITRRVDSCIYTDVTN